MFISLICDHWLLHTWHKNFVSQSPSPCRAFRPIRISLKIAPKRRRKSFFICPSAKEEDHCWWENTRFYWMDNFFLTEIRIPGNMTGYGPKTFFSNNFCCYTRESRDSNFSVQFVWSWLGIFLSTDLINKCWQQCFLVALVCNN